MAGKFDYAVVSHVVEDVMNPEMLGAISGFLRVLGFRAFLKLGV